MTRWRSQPIAVYLVILALVALVPSFIFSAILLQRNNEAQARVVETLVTATARSIVQSVDREINANVTTMKVLATTPSLLQGDYAAFHDRVRTALAGTGNYVYIVERDMMSPLSTRAPLSEQKTIPITDIATAEQAFTSRDVVVSDGVVGAVSRQWVVNILLPVFPPDREPLLLGFSRSAAALSSALLSSRIPEGWHVALVDRKGNTLAASQDGGETGERFDLLGDEDLISSTGWQPITRDGENYFVVRQTSLMTGWTLAMWAKRDVVEKPLEDAFWTLIAGGVLVAAVVVLSIYFVSLRIGRSVHGLQSDAKRLGSGQPVEARPFPITEIATVSEALGEASRRRQTAETEVRFLMRELAHRSKNQMTVIAAMAKQTARGADSVPEFVSSFEKRIFGLARSTDLLLAHGVAGVDLKELLISQIDPFCPVDGKRVVVDGPDLRLNAQAAQIIGMAAHELATNAVKYGAFAVEDGEVKVTWSQTPDAVSFVWEEAGTNPGPDTHRRGFGTTVLENMVGRSLGGEVTREVRDNGLTWRFTLPMSSLDPSSAYKGKRANPPPGVS